MSKKYQQKKISGEEKMSNGDPEKNLKVQETLSILSLTKKWAQEKALIYNDHYSVYMLDIFFI